MKPRVQSRRGRGRWTWRACKRWREEQYMHRPELAAAMQERGRWVFLRSSVVVAQLAAAAASGAAQNNTRPCTGRGRLQPLLSNRRASPPISASRTPCTRLPGLARSSPPQPTAARPRSLHASCHRDHSRRASSLAARPASVSTRRSCTPAPNTPLTAASSRAKHARPHKLHRAAPRLAPHLILHGC